MLNQKDIAVLQGMFAQQNAQWDIRFSDFKHEIRDKMHSVVNAAVAASERRLTQRIDKLETDLRKEISDVKDAVIEIIDDGILPQIEENRVEILGIKRRLTLLE